jgi:FkbM family methyltransferase
MTCEFFTFCVDIKKHSVADLQKCLLILVQSMHRHVKEYKLICFTNFTLPQESFTTYNIEFRNYYDNDTTDHYKNKWLNLSFNKINMYKDLHNEFNTDYTWIDLDTVIAYDISYINQLANCFVENGGNCTNKNVLFKNHDDITVPRNRYIQGNFWKLNSSLYEKMMSTFRKLTAQGRVLRYDLQDLFNYCIYVECNGDSSNFNIIGYNVRPESINGLCVWSKEGNTHATAAGLGNLYYDNHILKTTFFQEKEIHIVSFTFDTLKQLWDNNMFNKLFIEYTHVQTPLVNVGVFGTCRIDDYNVEDFVQHRHKYPYIFKNRTHCINVRPLGYTTTTSDVYQNLSLIQTGEYKNITDPFIYRNVLLKHGGADILPTTTYNVLVLEICSIKKIVHLKSNYIFPYEIEGSHQMADFKIETESFDDTVQNILKIRDLLNCEIVLLPPITEFEGKHVVGVHENPSMNKVLEYRNDIINRLQYAASAYENVYFFDWNLCIKERGPKIMLHDQFHFSSYGKKYISQYIYHFIQKRTVIYQNENLHIKIPFNNNQRHRFYQMFESRDGCEVLFRLLIKYFYDNNILDKMKNVIDLGAWIGDNSIPWAMRIDGIVYAIDPSADNINYINELSMLNGLTNVCTIQKCISDKLETVYTNGDLKHAAFNIHNGHITIHTTSLDILFDEHRITNVGFIHLDVEGFEQKVLTGSMKVLQQFRPVVVWENHLTTDNYIATCEFFLKLKYTTYLINETFPHCNHDCRNFLSVPCENTLFDITTINQYFGDERYIHNKADIKRPFLILL